MEFPRRRKIDANIDMTPMIDTLLQLFVVFMLNMSFLVSAVQLNLPKASAAPLVPEAPVVVSLDAAGRMFINGELATSDGLRDRLQTLLLNMKERKVVLRADRALSYETVLETLIAIQRAGVAQVHLAYEGVGRGQ